MDGCVVMMVGSHDTAGALWCPTRDQAAHLTGKRGKEGRKDDAINQ